MRRVRRLEFSPFWFGNTLFVAAFLAAAAPALAALIVAATFLVFRLTWRVPLALALLLLAAVPAVGATRFHGLADLVAMFVLELGALAVTLAAVEERRERRR